MPSLTRRSFLTIVGLSLTPAAISAAGTSLVPAPAPWPASANVRARPRRSTRGEEPAHAHRYAFFDHDDAAFMEAAVERLIPADEDGPGALQVGVVLFIDRQLAGPWGAGRRLYRNGPWQPRRPSQAHQLPRTPAELFRTALRGIESDLARLPIAPLASLASFAGRRDMRLRAPPVSARRGFCRLPVADQDAYLKSLQAGGKDLAGVPSEVFFETLLGLTIEGFFSDPVHGGDQEMLGLS